MSSFTLKGGLILTAAVGMLALVGLTTASDDAEARQPIAVKGKRWPVRSPQLEMTLESGFGEPLRTFQHQGQTFVLGNQGDRYQIRVTNRSNRRVEAVVTVDGRDVINGRQGTLRNRGYIVPPRDSIVIDGFRRSTSKVAAFRFSGSDQSYSALKGTPQNVGVIGVAFFAEKPRKRQAIARGTEQAEAEKPAAAPRSARKSKRRPSRGGRWAPGEASDSKDDDSSNIGTGWGEDRRSEVSHVRFRRASSQPTRLLTLRYDDATGLRRRGIRLRQALELAQPPRRGPEAFPAR